MHSSRTGSGAGRDSRQWRPPDCQYGRGRETGWKVRKTSAQTRRRAGSVASSHGRGGKTQGAEGQKMGKASTKSKKHVNNNDMLNK